MSFWPRYTPNNACRLALIVSLGLCASSCTKHARQERIVKRAENYFAAGKYDQAKVEYSNLLRFDSRGALPYLRLGTIWTDEGAPLRAVPFLLKSRELAPNDLENRLRLALSRIHN
jgi:tetratricopeptide (TPR) repeat protein